MVTFRPLNSFEGRDEMCSKGGNIRPAPTGAGGLLRNIGPGVVVSGSVVGSGELLVTTRMGAEVGFVFLWGVILACVVKFFLQVELGRQCLLHRRSTIQVLDQVAGIRFRDTSWIAWLCVVGYFSVMIALIGIYDAVTGLMITVIPALSTDLWAVLIFLFMSVLLYRGAYDDVEKLVTALVATFSLIVIGSVLLLQGTPYAVGASELASGFRLDLPAEGAFVALAVMGSVGATAVELFMYPYWIREKGYPDFVGRADGSPEWKERYRGWMRVLYTDALVCTGIATAITCAYYLLGASVLNQLNVVPQGMKVVEQVSVIFTATIGDWAYYIFMFGGFCTLFSTLVVFTASSGRISVDFLQKIGVRSMNDDAKRLRLMRLLQVAFPFSWLLATLVLAEKPLALLMLGANANTLLLIPLAFGVLHLAMAARGEERMSIWTEIGLLLSIWTIISFTAVNHYLK